MNNETRMSKLSDVKSRLWVGGALIIALAMNGCGAAHESAPTGGGSSADSQGETGGEATPGSALAQGQPSPVASLTLENGNVIDFYDFKSGVLVSETGPATQGPVLIGKGEPIPVDELAATWTRLAPDTPVPEALTELQERMMNLPESAVLHDQPIPEFAGSGDFLQPRPPDTGEAARSVAALREECNNNCCDLDWLQSTFHQCRPQNYPYEWLHFNYGWSARGANSVIIYQGLVCAAKETSQYKLSVQQVGNYMSLVSEGQWKSYQFNAGWTWYGNWDEKSVNTTVNTDGFGNHLHSYCGHIAYGD